MDLTEHPPTEHVRTERSLAAASAELARRVAEAPTVVPVGARTQWEVGGPPPDGVEVRAPRGVVRYEPADLTVTVGAGTPVADLDALLRGAGQECPLDPVDPAATVGGVLACGLSGLRRLRHGPLRDRVLEVRFATADGRLVKGGGPTVKNVSGYDIPRLLVGSLGTLGVLARVTLRCVALPPASRWTVSERDPSRLRRELLRPSSVLWDGRRTWCLLEGHEADVDEQCRRLDLSASDQPFLPEGPYRGRISVRPTRLPEVGGELAPLSGVRWLAEIGVGTVRVAADSLDGLRSCRGVARRHGGWLLREAGGGLDGFGELDGDTSASELPRRVKRALDPGAKLNPGRLPW